MATKHPLSVVRVLVVEDFEPFRRFVCTTLRAKPEWQIVAESADGLDGVRKAKELEPDVILLDIGLPTLNGIEAAEIISKVVPHAKVLFVTQENDPDIAATALSNGAKGLVLKVNAHRELLPAVEAVLAGQRFISSAVAQRQPYPSEPQQDLQ